MRFDGLPISEEDLLAWVEGESPEERRREVDRALMDWPDARRALEGMAADRRALVELGAARVAAPEGIVRRALAMAERETVLGEPEAVVARIGPMIRRRFAVAAALAATFGVSWIAINGVGLRPRTLRPPAQLEPGERMAALTDAPDPQPTPLARSAPAAPPVPPAPAAPASVAPAVALADAALAAQPVTREVVDSMLPLRDLLAAVEAAEADPSRRFIMLETLEGQPRPVARARDVAPARLTPASTSDALMLASINRLNLRVQARDPGAIDRALRAYCDRVNRDARMVAQVQPDGSVRYAVETDREEGEISLLLAALRNACEECVQTTRLDASLAPTPCPMTRDAAAGWPECATSPQRVSLPVMVQRIRP